MIAALSRWFLSLFPPHWWDFYYKGDPNLWLTASSASPLWCMFSAAMLAFTMVGAWPISIFAALAHGVIAVGQLMACLGHLWRSGTDWSVTELLSLHALWINLLFGGLHILNVSRNADRFKDGPVQEGDG